MKKLGAGRSAKQRMQTDANQGKRNAHRDEPHKNQCQMWAKKIISAG